MKYFIFNYKTDLHLIDSFLESAASAKSQGKNNKDWFLWKFRDNPFGESILACAEEKGKITGCVAYGMQDFMFESKIIKGVLSFETFVHPEYQRRGIFSKLLYIAEKKAIERGVKLMLNFPNTNSLKGFLNKDWIKLNVSEYYIKSKKLFTIPIHFFEIRKGFVPAASEINLLDFSKNFEQFQQKNLHTVITGSYLKWRFDTLPKTTYHFFDQSSFNLVVRVGYRGVLKEVQVLFVNIKNKYNFNLKEIEKLLFNRINYDLISFPISTENELRILLKKRGYIKVPSRTNVCYKILDSDSISNAIIQKISLNAINYHTY